MKPIKMELDDVATPEESLEVELAIIQDAGIKVKYRGYQRGLTNGFHIYDVLEPRIPGYAYSEGSGLPTLTLKGMREKGLIR